MNDEVCKRCGVVHGKPMTKEEALAKAVLQLRDDIEADLVRLYQTKGIAEKRPDQWTKTP